MDPIRVGIVRFLNTTPLVDGLEKLPQLALTPVVPSRLAGMLRGGEVDLALVSVIDAARTAADGTGSLSMLSCGMIGCDGPTLTVRVFSAVPLDQATTLAADTDSHTSIALAQVILKRAYGRSVKVVPFDARERVARGGDSPEQREWPETLLMIGDKVVTDSPPAVRYPYQLDLGEEWKKLTGLPFVYAIWMCRSVDVENAAQRERLSVATALLDRQLRHNLTRMDRIILEKASEFRWPPDLARKYLGELLRYRVGEREREAVRRFFAECVSADLITSAEARFVEM
ncbi:MAG: menaquinone biosynthesis protein [Phycisphaerales bacterium]|nr:menaquinone biosynthesis protein [Phycisphaerales bacterium]